MSVSHMTNLCIFTVAVCVKSCSCENMHAMIRSNHLMLTSEHIIFPTIQGKWKLVIVAFMYINYLQTTPEGGWGWVVVFASFVFHFFSLGTKKALGVFVPHIGAAFDIGDGAVGMIFGISLGLKSILGNVNISFFWNYGVILNVFCFILEKSEPLLIWFFNF